MPLSKTRPVIAIDGPAGSGKSTVAKLAAKRLGFDYIDTGAMYRALTLKILRGGVDVADEAGIGELAARTVIEQEADPDGLNVLTFLDGEDVSAAIRLPDVTASVSAVASHPEVRRLLVEHQRYLAQQADKGDIIEGRDVGTVVFPDAAVKIYLDASPATRAQRRLGDMQASGVDVSLEDLADAITARDRLDSTRAASPLQVATDAHVIDTSGMSIAAAVQAVVDLAKKAGLAGPEV